MNRFDLQKLAELRMKEANALLDAGCFEGAYYLAGYAVECAIKACIAKLTKEFDFPDKETVNRSYTHKLEQLIQVAQLKEELEKESAANPTIERYWNAVKDWKEEVRYELEVSEARARNFYQAITDADNGVMQWLKKSW